MAVESSRPWKALTLLYLLVVGVGIAAFMNINKTDQVSGALPTALIATSPQFRGMATPTHTMQNTMTGIGASPMQQLAISAIEASNRCGTSRDVSASANLRNMFSSLDPKSKSQVVRAAKAAEFKVEEMAGVTAPLGFFDPLGFTSRLPEGKVRFYREVELKHGRVCMLAALGFIVGENFHPLFGGNIDTAGIYAFQETPLETFWPAVVAALAIPEIFSVYTFNEPYQYFEGEPQSLWSIKADHVPGDLGFDPLGLKPTDPAEFKEMQTKELNNGRLAMIAAAGMVAQELVDGKKILG
jgi:hypothetical protein